MYCSHCGKKVGDTMLFCPFCGEPIVIPEQDAADADARTAEAFSLSDAVGETPAPDAAGPVENPDNGAEAGDAAAELLDWSLERLAQPEVWAPADADAETFSPLRLEESEDAPDNWREEIEKKKQAVVLEKKPPQTRRTEAEPVRLEGSAPKLEMEVEGAKDATPRKGSRKHANTLVPPKTMDPNDIFMDGKPAPYEEYDPYDDDAADDFAEGFVFEDEEESSFFLRHLRGIVGLGLFVILILMFVIYAFSRAGQATLARANLAWSAEAYSALGYQNYQGGAYADAGLFYERALQRDPENYSFASSAAMAYIEAGNTDRATAMLKRCAEIDPAKLEPYFYLLKLYPDAASRPWDVTQLLQQGYRQTGDSRLNVTG